MDFLAVCGVVGVTHASRVIPDYPLEVIPILGIVCGDLVTAVENLEAIVA